MTPKPLFLSAAALVCCLTLACQKPATPNNQPKAASAPEVSAAASAPGASDPLQAAVEKYLTEVRGLDLSKMVLKIQNQKVEGSKASCEGAFTVKGMDGMPPMEYIYELVQENGAWKVVSSKAKGDGHAGPAPAAADMPAGHPESGENVGGLPLPPGHPPMGGAPAGAPADGGKAPAMPAGHPTTSPAPATAK